MTPKNLTNLILLLIILLSSAYCLAGEPPSEPILRIETGMHTAMITSIVSDKENRYIITGSYDGTARMFDASTLRLLKVYRPPLDKTEPAWIYKIAISPDADYIALLTDEKIYLFDRETAKIVKTIRWRDGGRLGTVAFESELAFSVDGRYLYFINAILNVEKLFSLKDFSGEKPQKLKKSGIYMISSSQGNFVLIEASEKYSKLTKKGEKVILSPDGSKIAYAVVNRKNDEESSITIEVYSVKDLKKIYSTTFKSDPVYKIQKIFWSEDGQKLYVATGITTIRNRAILELKGLPIDKESGFINIDLPHAHDEITDIVPLKDEKFGVVTNTARILIINREGEIVLHKDNEFAMTEGIQKETFLELFFGIKQKYPLLSSDGSKVGFCVMSGIYVKDLKIYNFTFDVINKILSYGHHEGLEPSSLKNDQHIEVSDNKYIKFDTDIKLVNKKGKSLWEASVPAEYVWGLNVSKNKKVAVALLGDGTIRWYRIEDGKELLAFFLHRDLKRWVLWTPKGYYDASPGGEELIGWHINNGKYREADFFPVSKFRDRFYRPDIIAKLFTTYDEDRAIALANEESGKKRVETQIKDILPPVITILSPQDGSNIFSREITVRYSLRNPSGEPVTAIKVLIDGRPVSQQRGLMIKPKGEDTGELKINVPERDFELSLIAENKYSASVPSTVRLFWAGKKEEFVVKPKLYILAIGVSKYKDESLRLQFAHKDAEDFVKTMQTQKGKLYEDVVVKLLTDEKATKDEILDGLDWLQKETTSKDVAMLFIAGHGINDSAGIYYFLPQNADLEKLKRTAVAFSDIKNTVSSIAGKVVMFVDTCHSGGVMGKRAVTDITGVINELTSAENGVVVFASSTGRQYSLEDPQWQNGAFTKAVVEGLKGKADLLGKGKITINMLDAFIAERVKEITKGKQTPVTTKPVTVPDFPVAVR